jgi:hypothetical protein
MSHASTVTMSSCEGPFIPDQRPYVFVRQLAGKADHAGARRSMLDDPENFSFRAMTPETVMLEAPGSRVQLGRRRPVPVTERAVTIDAGTLAGIQGFPPLNCLG